ncbi:hypothetical protein FQA39_LY12016 [Lamprigera yunnana]|nr:hypothetical protein FQA39_LY12016 [Lamprigera yunnana]
MQTSCAIIISNLSILRVNYDLLKARQQLKRAECESDLNTDEEGSLKRKRKQKQYSSSDENDDNGVTIKNRLSTQIPSPPPPTSNQGNTSTDLEKHVTILETQDNSTHFTQALENVAKKLAKICQRLDAIEENQRKILEKVGNECSEPVQEVQNLPEGLIPCSSLDEIKRLENWLKEAVHEATLESTLRFLGGKNLKAVVHRVLEKIFSAKVVPLCNWTGKYQKTALKNLLVTQIIIQIFCLMALFEDDLVLDVLEDDDEEVIVFIDLIEHGLPRQLYERADYFHQFDDAQFRRRFRLSRDSVLFLLEHIEEHLEFPNNSFKMPETLCLVCGVHKEEAEKMHNFPRNLEKSKAWQGKT